ncbi:hypothetical protein E2C01_085613 [Portunus trituberculatus]|uniref:Uncharacterized protein n=1 Tax=Portunus trituberculatus TaxID=210409 RepID=A0A5B7JB01_PORTR|nr:hypothetical protein [Portunus trituberculatus]
MLLPLQKLLPSLCRSNW